jgi:hypothetical protein
MSVGPIFTVVLFWWWWWHCLRILNRLHAYAAARK